MLTQYIQYLEIRNYQKNSIKHYCSRVKAFEAFKAKMGGDINDYYLHLQSRRDKKKLKNSSLNSHLQGLKNYSEFLKSTNRTTYTLPMLREKVTHEKIDYLSLEEIRKLFNSTQSRPEFMYRDQAVLGCLYHLGLRVCEASNLLLEDVDMENNLVFIQKSKTGYQRQVPISATLKIIFQNYLEHRDLLLIYPNDYFLLGLKGKLTSKGSISQILKRLKTIAQIKKRVHPHLLRHTIATHLYQNGMPLEKVSQFLGHKNIGSTERYTHL